MKTFTIKITLFSLLLLASLLGFYYINYKFIAAHKTTNSYSFNEKIKWLQKVEYKDIVSIGSSMTLTNISSKEVVKGLNTKQYINLSSWGLKLVDIERLTPFLNTSYKPKILIIASNLMDFSSSSINFDIELIKNEIDHKSPVSLLQILEKYYRTHTIENRTNYSSRDVYTSLRFDKYGGVPYATNNFHTIATRWHAKLDFEKIDQKNYLALAKISIFLKQNHVHLVFIQTPIRQNLITLQYKREIKSHLDKINLILKNDRHLFIDLSSKKYPDSFFVDSTHLNSHGANFITREIVKEINSFSTLK